MFVCAYVACTYVCVCWCTYIHTYTCAYVCDCVCIHMCVCTHVYVCSTCVTIAHILCTCSHAILSNSFTTAAAAATGLYATHMMCVLSIVKMYELCCMLLMELYKQRNMCYCIDMCRVSELTIIYQPLCYSSLPVSLCYCVDEKYLCMLSEVQNCAYWSH